MVGLALAAEWWDSGPDRCVGRKDYGEEDTNPSDEEGNNSAAREENTNAPG